MSSESWPEGVAVVYCEAAFGNGYGKTAHGLVRFTRRYRVAAVIDSTLAGKDAGEVLDGAGNGIPLVADLSAALHASEAAGERATHFVIGLAPDGGVLDERARAAVCEALDCGLHVDSGLHRFLSEDPELADLAFANGVRLRDVRKPPPRSELHFYSGKIREVDSLVVAVLGTDSAVGKRTTAWKLVQSGEARGMRSELVGTGQTAWMQGARFGVRMDALVNDFVAGEIEHAVWAACKEGGARLIVVEGQGSLMHPAYPGGFEILGAARPDAVVLQHAPARLEYDGFPGCPMHAIERQIQAIELVGSVPVVAVTLNHEHLDATGVAHWKKVLHDRTGLPVVDALVDGTDALLDRLLQVQRRKR